MHPVIVMFIGTCADMRPIRIIFSPVSGWKAESKTYLALHRSSSVSPGETIPSLQDSERVKSYFSFYTGSEFTACF